MVYNLSEVSEKPLVYVTESQPQSGTFVQAQVISSWKAVAEDCADGYEWLGIRSLIRSESPCCWVLSYEDFYTQQQYDDRKVTCGAEEGGQYKKAEFSLNFQDTVYDSCRMQLVIHQPTEQGTEIEVSYCVPAGYDGCVLGFHNSAALTQKQLEAGMSDPSASLGLIRRMDGDLYLRLK